MHISKYIGICGIPNRLFRLPLCFMCTTLRNCCFGRRLCAWYFTCRSSRCSTLCRSSILSICFCCLISSRASHTPGGIRCIDTVIGCIFIIPIPVRVWVVWIGSGCGRLSTCTTVGWCGTCACLCRCCFWLLLLIVLLVLLCIRGSIVLALSLLRILLAILAILLLVVPSIRTSTIVATIR